jgi:hypothetical protein
VTRIAGLYVKITYSFYHILLISSRLRNVGDKVVEKIKKNLRSIPPPKKNHAVYEMMWEKTVDPDRLQVKIWCMCIDIWIPKATNTH